MVKHYDEHTEAVLYNPEINGRAFANRAAV